MKINKHWSSVKRLLVIRLDNMGDVLMTTPAIRALKQTFAHGQITLLTSHIGSEVGAYIDAIDDVIIYDAPWVNTYEYAVSDLGHIITLLKRRHFDATVIFTVYSQNPYPAILLTYLAGIPLRLSYSHENPYLLLTDWVPDPEPQLFIRHEVERQMELVRHIGADTRDTRLSFSVPVSDSRHVSKLLASYGLFDDRHWFVVHPGVREKQRQYSLNKLGAALRLIQHRYPELFM